MATKPGYFYEFPWHRLGSYKYVVFAPMIIGHLPKLITDPIGASWLAGSDTQLFFDMFALITINRYFCLWLIQAASRCDAISGKTRIQERDFEFEQVDQEDDWDNALIMNALSLCAIYAFAPASWFPQRMAGSVDIGAEGVQQLPWFDWRGYVLCLFIQCVPVEFLYYWFHRALHTGYLWDSYHSHHHSAYVTEAISGNSHPLFENFCYMVLFASTVIIPWHLGCLSISLFFVYTTLFDLTNAMGHCNFEFLPAIFNKAPLKYLLYTPSFHSIHHSRVHYNYCLFMPWTDYLFGTVHEITDKTYEMAAKGRPIGNPRAYTAPDAVFFIHGGLPGNIVQIPFVSRSMNATPMKMTLFNLAQSVLWDLFVMRPMEIFGLQEPCGAIPFAQCTVCKGQPNQVKAAKWALFRIAREYVTKDLKKRKQIAKEIENAIVDADKKGVKVCGLAALNKAHWINNGGLDIIKNHPNLRTRVVHGNTMTAGAVLASIPRGTTDVVLTGCTSKVGRVLAMKMALKGMTVQMVTMSRERFLNIVDDLANIDVDASRRLVQQTDLASPNCQQCPLWIIGKWLPHKDVKHVPTGAAVLNYCFPPPPIYRTDVDCVSCASLVVDRKVVTGLHTTTAELDRGTWYACNVGTIVHALEGWTHHEVGGVDIDQVDVCWAAAKKYGFTLSEETLAMLKKHSKPDEATPKIRDSLGGCDDLLAGNSIPILGSGERRVMLSTDALPIWTMEQMRTAMKQGRTQLMAIEGHVVDVSVFAEKHPGGEYLLKKYYGGDATDAFNGGVYEHSRAARKIMRKHRIAKLEALPAGIV
jgi:sterol desaturase/sphingolipid hydroxylase (fatty acid hydroxylase superfamily)/cytochrome b involved in lipid metabolism